MVRVYYIALSRCIEKRRPAYLAELRSEGVVKARRRPYVKPPSRQYKARYK